MGAACTPGNLLSRRRGAAADFSQKALRGLFLTTCCKLLKVSGVSVQVSGFGASGFLTPETSCETTDNLSHAKPQSSQRK
jgi:hypothetical protein